MDIPLIFWLAPVASILGLIAAYNFYKKMVASDPGSSRMQEIAGYVTEGAMAYLKQQYKIVSMFFIAAFFVFMFMAFVLKVQHWLVPIAFLTGGFFSGLCGWLGMKTATKASNRTAQAASVSLNAGLQVAFRSGAVMGLVVVGLGLLDICIWFVMLRTVFQIELIEATIVMLNFGMGASFQALFARVGGGIFTKAADVGADLVGKVEAGIPEDDPRNPAVIADNVGDNVGDVAGMGADLYESYCGSILATAALGATAFLAEGVGMQVNSVVAPILIAGVGIIASIVGIYMVKSSEKATQGELLKALARGINASAVIIVIASAIIVKVLLPGHFGIFFSIVSGLVAGIIIGKATEYYTSDEYEPTKWVAAQCQTGPATTIIGGLAIGMQSTLIPVLTVVVGMIFAFAFSGGFTNIPQGLYGIGIAAVGMLSTLGITLATDAYGPIADNAGGNAEMSHLPPEVRQRTDALDSLGNTTAATGKGFAIGSAALTALALLAAYVEEIKMGLVRVVEHGGIASIGNEVFTTADAVRNLTLTQFMNLYEVNLMNPNVLVGLFIGTMMVLFFCALTMKAVGRTAAAIVVEVRRQFKEIPGLLEGKPGAKADYARCVSICTLAAQKEMVIPSILAFVVPVIVGIIFDVSGVMGLLAGGLSCGFLMAVMMANAGGAWDNAKKHIERGAYGGKGSVAHKAAVVGDTVGDPFKDTSGPSLNILIKLMSMVAIVFAGLTAKYPPLINLFAAFVNKLGM